MKQLNKFIILLLIIISIDVSAQNVKVYGIVTNALNNEPIPFANVVVDGTSLEPYQILMVVMN